MVFSEFKYCCLLLKDITILGIFGQDLLNTIQMVQAVFEIVNVFDILTLNLVNFCNGLYGKSLVLVIAILKRR